MTTLEGLQKEAEEFGMFLAAEGGEQCGFCSPGFIMNVLAMERELDHPDEEDIKEYLAGNLCRCSGYMSQLRAVKKYLERKDAADTEGGCLLYTSLQGIGVGRRHGTSEKRPGKRNLQFKA